MDLEDSSSVDAFASVKVNRRLVGSSNRFSMHQHINDFVRFVTIII